MLSTRRPHRMNRTSALTCRRSCTRLRFAVEVAPRACRSIQRYGSRVRPDVAWPPLIYPDVDCVLIPFRACLTRSARPSTDATDAHDRSGNPLLDRLNPDDGQRVLLFGWRTGLGDHVDGGGDRRRFPSARSSGAACRRVAGHRQGVVPPNRNCRAGKDWIQGGAG